MSGQLVLVTGATGFIAQHIIVQLLESGYRVRGTVRKPNEALTTLLRPYGDKVELAEVLDITIPGAFDNVLQDVDYVIHAASPLPRTTDDYKRDMYEPAVKGTTNILDGAKSSPNIKRVVVTSSNVDMVPFGLNKLFVGKGDYVFSEKDHVQGVTEDYEASDTFAAYVISKVLADNALWRWRDDHPEAPFDIVTVNPSFTFGKNLTQSSPSQISGTNGLLWNVLTTGIPTGMPAFAVHVEDAARAHVLALDKTKVSSGQRLLSTIAGATNWDVYVNHAKKRWPNRKWAEVQTPSPNVKCDNSLTTKTLGIEWKGEDKMVDDVVEQMITLGA